MIQTFVGKSSLSPFFQLSIKSSITIIVCCCVVALCLTETTAVAESVGGWWQFNATSPLDSSGNGNEGELFGDATIINGVLRLGGRGYMKVPDSFTLSPQSSIFLEIDIFFDEIRSDWIIDKMTDDYKNGYLIRTLKGSNEILFYLGLGTKTEYVRAKIKENKKYKVLAIYDGSYICLYLNGVIQDWKSLKGKIAYDGTEDIYIGSNKGKKLLLNAVLDNIYIGNTKNLPLSISSKAIPGGQINRPFRFQVEAFGGKRPYHWTSYGLPEGLILSAKTGIIEGAISGTHDLTFHTSIGITDSSQPRSSHSLKFTSTFLYELGEGVSLVSGNGTHRHATTVERTGPQIVFRSGKTGGWYVVYQNIMLDPEVVFLNSSAMPASFSAKAAINPLKNDRHGHPAIAVDKLGFVHILYGAHVSSLRHVRSATPNDISKWISLPDIAPEAAYPNMITVSDNSMLVFFRSSRAYGFKCSMNNGMKWGDYKTVIDYGPDFCVYPDAGTFWDQHRGCIHLSWSQWDYGKHKHQGIYYAKSLDRGISWHTSQDQLLANPISRADSEVVYYKEDEITYGEDIACDSDGDPIILFSTKDASKGKGVYKIAVFKNRGWHFIDVAETYDVNVGGALHVIGHLMIVYLINQDHQLEEWAVTMEGKSRMNVICPSVGKDWQCYAPKIAFNDKGKPVLLFNCCFGKDVSYIFSYSNQNTKQLDW